MDINATLLGQILVFVVFIWVTLKYIWPPIMKAMHEREKKIAEGLEAGERGKQRLETAKTKSIEIMQAAKKEAAHAIEQASTRAVKIVDEAKEQGVKENQRIVANAQIEIKQQVQQAKEALRLELVNLVVGGAEKILEKEVDLQAHEKLFDRLVTELE